MSGQVQKGLKMLNKAIEIDSSIPEFFKERSKYYYALGRFEEAAIDIIKVLEETHDDEAKLLLTFYYYMTNEYQLSLDLLCEVSEHSSEEKFQ